MLVFFYLVFVLFSTSEQAVSPVTFPLCCCYRLLREAVRALPRNIRYSYDSLFGSGDFMLALLDQVSSRS